MTGYPTHVDVTSADAVRAPSRRMGGGERSGRFLGLRDLCLTRSVKYAGGYKRGSSGRGYSLLELLLVIALLALLAGAVIPNLWGQLRKERLPRSARQMRSLVQLTRANAMLDGKRYRLRFPRKDEGGDELDSEGTEVQPMIEWEDEPFNDPGVYKAVTASWAQGATLLEGIWCAKVRMGKPTVEQLLRHYNDVTADLEEDEELTDAEQEEKEALFEEFDEDYPPLVFEPDGTSEWAVFVLTDAPLDADEDSLNESKRIEVIYDGLTGLAWLQRPFEEEELEMLQEHDWPPVLRKDFLRSELLTEDQVIEIQESLVRR